MKTFGKIMLKATKVCGIITGLCMVCTSGCALMIRFGK